MNLKEMWANYVAQLKAGNMKVIGVSAIVLIFLMLVLFG